MKQIAVDTIHSPYFERCWELYESAFPANERRELGYHLQTMERSSFHFDALFDEDVFVGVIGWWEFPQVRFVEHLAVSPELRNGGYGRKTLSMLKSQSDKLLLLEVEHPEDEMSRRRIGFYEREGFVLNTHPYTHPPYRGTERLSLLVMTYPEAISASALERFCADHFPEIHFR